jgi:hypothetical protein
MHLSNDDTTIYVPFNPLLNSDYNPPVGSVTGPYVGTGHVGLLSLSSETGLTLWCNLYVSSSGGTISPLDGDISIENSRYFMMVDINDWTHLLVISTADGSIRR